MNWNTGCEPVLIDTVLVLDLINVPVAEWDQISGITIKSDGISSRTLRKGVATVKITNTCHVSLNECLK